MRDDSSAQNAPTTAPAAWLAALSDAALQRASSAAIFGRGRTYAASGAVMVLAKDCSPVPVIRARVAGSMPYTTELRIAEGSVQGGCDCPNAQDGYFCKHQVALGLVWRDRLSGVATAIDAAARKTVQTSQRRARTIEARWQALREFLHAQPSSALAERLLDWAERDPAIARELHQWRQLAEAPRRSADLKPLVTEILTAGQRFLTWRDTSAYVRRAEAVLPLLREVREQDPAAAVTLALHALQRGWTVLEQADDSSGDVSGLCTAIGREWVAALQAAGAQPARFADTYLRVQLDDPFGSFDAAAAEAAMGVAALARYRQLLAARWRKASDAVRAAKAEQAADSGRRRQPVAGLRSLSAGDVELMHVERLHLQQLEATGEIDEALAVMREDVSEPHRWSAITRLLEAHGRYREAFANAEHACRAFPDRWPLQDDLLRCYERDGWTEEALALRRRQFELEPSVERYGLVLRAGAAAGRDCVRLRDELLAWIEARERDCAAPRALGAARRPRPTSKPMHDAPDVTLRAEVLCAEQRWIEACALVQPPARCRTQVLHRIALHLGPEHGAQAVELLLRVFEATMPQSMSPYRAELALVAEIAERMQPDRRVAWLATLAQHYKAKRNFVRGLPDA